MNTHVNITNNGTDREPADLSRRSFLVGSAAAGLALGYSAVPGLLGADQAFAAAGNFDPSVWYSIAPDGIVTVACGKADEQKQQRGAGGLCYDCGDSFTHAQLMVRIAAAMSYSA